MGSFTRHVLLGFSLFGLAGLRLCVFKSQTSRDKKEHVFSTTILSVLFLDLYQTFSTTVLEKITVETQLRATNSTTFHINSLLQNA